MGDAAPKGLPQPGDILDGKYSILRVIGEGGMGVVFEATHQKLGQRVAIKVLQPAAAGNATFLTRFEREARAAGRLRGRNVARVTDVEVSPGKVPYIVMEFLEGHDLATELDARGALPITESVDLLLQACKAMAEAHAAGIIHRDLKPSNLFLCAEGDERIVKLLDFGISKVADDASTLTATEVAVGTPLYMSPEQVRSARDVDARTDVWALGVILYELLAGAPPFMGSGPAVAAAIVIDEAPPLSSRRPDVPEGLDAVVRKAMAKRVADRFPDVPTLAAALAPFGSPRGASSSSNFLGIARLGSSPSHPRLDAELANAKTMLEETPAPRASSPELAATAATSPELAPIAATSPQLAPVATSSDLAPIAATSPGWVTRAPSPARRRAPWLAVGGAALVLVVATTAFLATRAGHATAGGPQPGTAATVPPTAEPAITATTTAATTATAPAAETAATQATATATTATATTATATPTTEPRAMAVKAPPRRTPAASASSTSGATPPPPPPSSPPARTVPLPTAPKKDKEKPPLVAPF